MNEKRTDDVFWYAVRTHFRAEKKIVESLRKKGIECFLPLRAERRRWSDRIKTIHTPLVTCYIFVKVSKDRMIDVLRTQGVLGFVCEERAAVAIPDRQMKKFIRAVESYPEDIDLTFDRIRPGVPVIVIRGPLMGLEGEAVESPSGHKVLIRLETIACALVSIDADSVEPI